MWMHLGFALLAAGLAAPVSASPWYAEVAYAGDDSGNVAAGYQFRPWFALEAGYRRSHDGREIGWGVPRRLDDADGFEVSMRTAIEVSPRFAITGRFGLYDWNGEHAVFRGSQPIADIVEREGVANVIGAGLRVKLTEHFSLTGEYTHSDAFERTSGPGRMISAGLRASF